MPTFFFIYFMKYTLYEVSYLLYEVSKLVRETGLFSFEISKTGAL